MHHFGQLQRLFQSNQWSWWYTVHSIKAWVNISLRFSWYYVSKRLQSVLDCLWHPIIWKYVVVSYFCSNFWAVLKATINCFGWCVVLWLSFKRKESKHWIPNNFYLELTMTRMLCCCTIGASRHSSKTNHH